MTKKPLITVLQENSHTLMSVEGVVGIAQGLCEGKDCIKVYVTKKTDKIVQELPKSLDGYIIDVIESGEIKAR